MSLEISTRPQVNVKSTEKIPCEFSSFYSHALSFAAVMDIFSLAIVILHVNLV